MLPFIYSLYFIVFQHTVPESYDRRNRNACVTCIEDLHFKSPTDLFASGTDKLKAP